MTRDNPGHDANGYWLDDATKQWQKVENQSWPAADVVRRIGDRPHSEWIDVTVRIVFERDGETLLDGRACRWVGRRVCVALNDRRLQVGLVWVDAADVTRR